MSFLPTTFIKKYPWATFGRKETTSDFISKYNQQCTRIALLGTPLKVSLIVIDIPQRDISETIESVMSQSYPHWELLVVGEKSKEHHFHDARIKHLAKDFSSSGKAKNFAIHQATGAWVGFLDAGDILSPVALFSFLTELQKDAAVQLAFSNEAVIDRKASKISQFFSKPKLHWFNLLHLNAIGKFWMVQASALHSIGMFDETLSSEEEYDFFHRADLNAWKTLHLPMYLYYRANPEKIDAVNRRLIVEKHLKGRGLDAFVHSLENRTDVQPILSAQHGHKVSAIILFKDKPTWTLKAVEHLAKQVGQIPLEVVLVNNGSDESSWEKIADGIKKYPFGIRIVDYPGEFNFGHINNWAIRNYATGDLVLLLNNDVFLAGENQIDLLASWAEKDWVGTVGIRLHYEHGDIQHSGLDARFGGNSRMVRVGNGTGMDPFSQTNHTVFGNTFACCMLKRKTFDDLNGFRDLDLANGFGDIAFNFECIRSGLQNLYLGTLCGTHLESASRGLSYEYWEECILEKEYPDLLQRMLREDLAMDRVPADESAILAEMKELILHELRLKAPWLKDLKRILKKNVSAMKKRRQLEA